MAYPRRGLKGGLRAFVIVSLGHALCFMGKWLRHSLAPCRYRHSKGSGRRGRYGPQTLAPPYRMTRVHFTTSNQNAHYMMPPPLDPCSQRTTVHPYKAHAPARSQATLCLNDTMHTRTPCRQGKRVTPDAATHALIEHK